MNNNSKLFQYLVLGAFIFFIIVGAILFATYRSSNTKDIAITVSIWGTLDSVAFSDFTTRYFSDNDLKYTVNYTQKNQATFDRELVEALASGEGPDAIILPEDLIVRYQNKIYPIPPEVLPELTFKSTFVEEGELYLNSSGALALPFSIDPLVMYWNRDTFNKAGITRPPTNWADIITLTSKVNKKDATGNILQSALALGEFRNVNNAKEIVSTLLMQAGNPIVTLNITDGSLEANLKNSDVNLPLQFFTNFSNPVRPEYSWNRSLPNARDAFANGDLALYFGFASEFMAIKNQNPNLNFDVAIVPQVKDAKKYSTFGNMLGFAIMKASPNPAGAFAVISSLTSAQAFPFWANLFNVSSARRDILSLPEKSAVKTVFNQSAVISRAWLDPDTTKTNSIFQEMIESYTTGRTTLDSAISTASDRLEALLINK